MTDATVYAVASGKGGVGKTTTAVNLGAGFAHAGRSVVVVDLDLGMANLADFVEATPAGPTLHDVLAGEATLDDALSHVSTNLDVILGSDDLEAFGKADPTGIRDILTELKRRYDVVVLDSGGGLSHDTALPLGLADSVIFVSTIEKPAVKNTKKTLDLTEILDGSIEGIVLTRIGGGKDEVPPAEIASSLGLKLVGSVPEDSTVVASANAGEPLLAYDSESPAAQSYLEMAYDLLGEPLPMDLGGEAETPTPAEDAPVTGHGEADMEVEAATGAEGEPLAEEIDEPAVEEAPADEGGQEAEPATDEAEAGAAVEEEAADAETAASEAETPAPESETPAAPIDEPDQEEIALGDESEDEDEGEESEVGADEDEVEEAEPPSQPAEEAGETEAGEPAEEGVEGEEDEEEEKEETKLVESQADEEEPEESRSFLSKITGGLLG